MPLPVLTIGQMREWEKASWAAGQSEAEVIRRVGREVARVALALSRPGDRILLLAGKGHNGDDTRAAREHLAERLVEHLDVTDPAAAEPHLCALLSLGPALVVDGLFGIGIDRPLSPDWVRFIGRINESGRPVLAVDVPSGLNGDTGLQQGGSVRARVTLTVGAPKVGLLQEPAGPFVGRLEVAHNVGLTSLHLDTELRWTTGADFAQFPPARLVASHKGSYGHLTVFAGSLGYHGAAVLAARGAQRAQPGLITLLTSEGAFVPVASQLQAVMVAPWSTGRELPGKTSALLAGPGLAAGEVSEALKDFVGILWRESELPFIADASALAWLPTQTSPHPALRVITPHPGEAARLLGTTSAQVQSNRPQAVRELSKRFGNAWVVLKGHQTLIGRTTGPCYVNPSGNPHLAQGGSGDLLSGYLAGLLAQPALRGDPLTTLRFAVWQHGAGADFLQRKRPNWVVEDLVGELGAQPAIDGH